jgi:hypothetical protein
MPRLFKHLLLHLPHMTMNTLKMEAAISCDTLGIICRSTRIFNFMQIIAASASQNNNQQRPRCPLPIRYYIPEDFVVRYAHSSG